MLQRAFRGVVFFAVGTGLALVASCATNTTSPTDAGADGPAVVNPCGPGTAKMCGDTCVDVQSDFQNCGDCGNVCPTDQVCSHGTCAVVCGGGSSRCGNNCVDLKSDPNNCGGCNNQCAGGQVCSNATCALTCQQPLTNCNGGCVDTVSDNGNCGTCGNACPDGETCVGGTCQASCQSPWQSCPNGDAGTTCVDVKSDPNNCNGCGNKCDPGYFCQNGVCGLNCAGGTTLCNNACVDESIDTSNCGACNNACTTGDTCSSGHCCPAARPVYCNSKNYTDGCDTADKCVVGGRIVGGYYQTCAINNSGATYCWGYNGTGSVGTGSTTTTEYDTAQAVNTLTSGTLALGAGQEHTCAVTTGGAAYCWGYGGEGEIGQGSFSNAYSPTGVSGLSSGTLRAAGAGYYASCFLLSNGAVKCSGYDYEGILALGSITFNSYDTPQTSAITSGMTNIGSGPTGYSACAITSSGGVQCWGYAPYGLGDGSTTSSGTPVTVSGISGATSVSTGYYNICVVTSAGALKCWGYGYYGANGDGSTTNKSTPSTATISGVLQACVGYNFTCAVTSGGAVECVGYNYYGSLGNGTTTNSTSWVTPISSGAVAVGCGYYHACALMSSGKAECWGYNYYGEVGNGTYSTTSPYAVTTPAQVSGF
jgi:alpha-tubulin suppressor-like RCC1 family protein